MHAAVVEALDACKQACRPGATYGDIFDAHAKALDKRSSVLTLKTPTHSPF